jgi:hypothetical protein
MFLCVRLVCLSCSSIHRHPYILCSYISVGIGVGVGVGVGAGAGAGAGAVKYLT